MIDKEQLLEELTIDEIKTLLIELGAQHFIDESDTKGHIITNTICHNISDGKMKLYYYIEAKRFHCYTDCGCSFNLYDLVIKNHKLKGIDYNLGHAINWILNKLGRSSGYFNKPEGFEHGKKENPELERMRRFSKKKKKVEIETPVYHDSIFNMFSSYHHPIFLEDNITHEAMDKFEIKYYSHKHQVIIPHRKWDTGELIGLKARSLNQWEIEAGFKYIPAKIGDITYSYPTYNNLYGYYQNKETIKEIGKVIIFESEKSVLQCESFYPNHNFSVALCGSNMSIQQAKMLLSLNAQEFILALDKEYDDATSEKALNYQKKLLRLGRMIAPYARVTVVFDTNNLIDTKNSPSDKGKEVLEELMKQKQEIRLVE